MYYCQKCMMNVDSYVKNVKCSFYFNDYKYFVKSERRFCAECNNFLYDCYLEMNLHKRIIRIKEKMLGVDASKVFKFRKKYHISRYQLSVVLGCSKKTIIKYEHYLIIPNEYLLIKMKTLLKNPFLLYVTNLPK